MIQRPEFSKLLRTRFLALGNKAWKTPLRLPAHPARPAAPQTAARGRSEPAPLSGSTVGGAEPHSTPRKRALEARVLGNANMPLRSQTPRGTYSLSARVWGGSLCFLSDLFRARTAFQGTRSDSSGPGAQRVEGGIWGLHHPGSSAMLQPHPADSEPARSELFLPVGGGQFAVLNLP